MIGVTQTAIDLNEEPSMSPKVFEVMMRAPARGTPQACRKNSTPGNREKMAFWLPIGMAAGFVALAESATTVIGTPEAALVGRVLEGGVVFWCLYHLFTKTFPQIQDAHAKNMERVCEVHEKACDSHRATMESLTESIKEAATSNREGMESLRREWSDTRNTLVDVATKSGDGR